jgi:hypothetical protein
MTGDFSYPDIKREMQGTKGLIKQVRAKFLPKTVEMAALAQKSFEEEGGDVSNIDDALNRLLILEYEIYLVKQDQVDDDFLIHADEVASVLNYPNIRGIIDDYNDRIKKGENPTHCVNYIKKVYMALADSNRQSRVARAGSSLMEHISYLLQKKGFEFRYDYHREQVLGRGCKVDYLFPNIDIFSAAPENCFAVACQTTANDRFRLSKAQMPQIVNSRNRACTAIGCVNFGDKLGPNSLTEEKLREARESNVKFVIIGSAIDERLRESTSVMSYTEWFEELGYMKPLWHKMR